MRKFKFQLYIPGSNRRVSSTGGVVQVCTAGDSDKPTIYDATGAAISNPMALTNGSATFYTANTVNSVDLYIMDGDGRFTVAKAVTPGDAFDIYVDPSRNQVAVIPFDVTYQTGDATETDSGFDFLAGTVVLPTPFIQVTTLDAGETIDAGLVTTDPNGFLAVASVNAAGTIVGTLLNTGQTIGALLAADESGAGVLVPNSYALAAAGSISWTLTAGSDTAEGFICLPYVLPYNASQV